MNKKSLRSVGLLSLVLGSLILFVFGVFSVWADIEASLFNMDRADVDRLPHFRCPAVITANETGIVSLDLRNPTEKPLNFKIRTYISDGYVIFMREYRNEVPLDPGESERLEWEVTGKDAAYGRFVLVRAHQLARSPFPYQNSSCGILLVNIPFLTGAQVVWILMGVGIFLAIGGLLLWVSQSRPIVRETEKAYRRMLYFGGTALLLAVAGLLGWWGAGILLTAVWVLMVLEIIFNFIIVPTRKTTTFDDSESD